jgi:AraC-like DNA-binding protein
MVWELCFIQLVKTYIEKAPTLELTNLIDCYWFADNQNRDPGSNHKVIPDNRVDILFIENLDKREIRFSGPMSKSFIAPSRKIFGVRFRPEYLFGLFNIPLDQFTDTSFGLDSFFNEERILRNLFDSCHNFDEFKKKCNQYFIEKLPVLSREWDRRIIETTNRLEAGYSLREVKESIGISDQHMRRLFKKHIGISPKKYEKISRFQNVKKNIMDSTETDWAEVAAQGKYFDQSHFISDCKELTNSTPSQYFC